MQNTHSTLCSGYLLTNCPSAPSSPFNALLCDNRAKTLQTCSVLPIGRQDGKNRDFILIFQLLSPLLHSNGELIPASSIFQRSCLEFHCNPYRYQEQRIMAPWQSPSLAILTHPLGYAALAYQSRACPARLPPALSTSYSKLPLRGASAGPQGPSFKFLCSGNPTSSFLFSQP